MYNTVNRKPFSVSSPKEKDVKNYFFNHYNFKGINDDKNFLSVDQETFSESNNVYVDTEGVLRSRPSLKIRNKSNNFTLNNVLDFYNVGSYVCYLTVEQLVSEKKYYVLFFDGESTYKCEILSIPNTALLSTSYYGGIFTKDDIKITAFENNLLIWTRVLVNDEYITDLKVFDTGTHNIRNSESIIYIPTTKAVSGGVESDVEPYNELTQSHYINYIFNNTEVNVQMFIDNEVIIEFDNKTFKATLNEFNYNCILVDTPIYLSNSENDDVYGYNDVNIPNCDIKNGIMIFYNIKSITGSTGNQYNCIINLSLNGKVFTYFDYVTDLLCPPILNFDGSLCCILKYDGIYVKSTNSTTYSSWTKISSFSNYRPLITQSSTPDNSQIGINFTVYDTTHYAVLSPSSYDSSTYCDNLCYNKYKLFTKNGEYEESYMEFDSNYKFSPIKPKISLSTSDINKLVILISTFTTSQSSSTTIVTSQRVHIIYGIPSISSGETVSHIDNELTHCYVLYTNTDLQNKNILSPCNYALKLHGNDVYTLRCYEVISLSSVVTNFNYCYIRHTLGGNLYVQDISSLMLNNNKLLFGSTIRQTGVNAPTDIIINDKVLNYNTSYNLPVNCKFIICYDNDVLYACNYDNKLMSSKLSNYSLNISKLVNIKNTIVFPEHNYELNNLYISNLNNLYISKDSSGYLYFPKINTQQLDFNITNLHGISQSEVAIFTENCIYYCKYSTNDDYGYIYSYYKSKLNVGCIDGSDVISTYDGSYTVFSTNRGLAAMTYQQFVSTDEQSISYISDNIYSLYNEYNVGPIKLYKHSYWIFVYKQNSNIAYILDTRNNSWWKFTYPKNCLKFNTIENEINLLQDLYIYKFDNRDDNYFDVIFDGSFKKLNICWKLVSQKLYLNAVNYYKHVINITLSNTLDVTYPLSLIMRVYCFRNDKTGKYVGSTKQDGYFDNNDDVKTIQYVVDNICTFVQRLNFSKLTEFQYVLESNSLDSNPIPLSICDITVKYKIGGQIR